VEIDPRLAIVYRRSLSQFGYPAPDDVAALEACDAEIPIGSLAALFRPSTESFGGQPEALLHADPQRVSETAPLLPGGRKVGISWRSFQKAARSHIAERKSIPLGLFARLAQDNLTLVDLQYGDVDAERAAFDSAHPGLRFQIPGLDLRDDIEGILAAIACCDLVITASNVTAHFAGALGKRTWLVYRGANPPFHYWAPHQRRSLWYPSVEVVTDLAWTDWETAFSAVAERLARE
jgi:hypothetical protein